MGLSCLGLLASWLIFILSCSFSPFRLWDSAGKPVFRSVTGNVLANALSWDYTIFCSGALCLTLKLRMLPFASF